MYSKPILEEIVIHQAYGFSGEESREALKNKFGVKPCLDTIYRHRKDPVGKELLLELIRHQERDILKADSEDREQAMRYRDKLIEKLMDRLMPTLTQVDSHHTEEIKEIQLIWHVEPSDKIRTPPRTEEFP
jgi:hypothetical protein